MDLTLLPVLPGQQQHSSHILGASWPPGEDQENQQKTAAAAAADLAGEGDGCHSHVNMPAQR